MATPGLKAGLDYEAALRRVTGLADFERASHRPGHGIFHLERMSLLLERLGNPHLAVPAVHIAGTKGKGSTAAMVTSTLSAGGYKVGLYTSPHLHTVVERIRVGLDPIERGDLASLVDQAWPAVEWVAQRGKYGPVTFFELVTAIAFLHFKQIGADIQVVEVGLGGRLDATNVVDPAVCVITRISLDHVSVLGNTVGLIAAEKAGIIKPGVPVVLAPQSAEAIDVLLRHSAEREAPVVRVADDISWRNGAADLDGQSFDLNGLRGSYRLWTPLLGDHQLENAATAVATVETLAAQGYAVSSESVREGLRRVRWPGRFQLISRNGKQVVVDGAHNPDSMKRLVQTVRKYLKFRRLILVFGATSGHSAREMMAEVAELSPSVVAVRSRHPRSVPANLLARTADELGLQVVFTSANVGLAARQALDMAQEGDLVLGTGSLAVVAEVTEELLGMVPELYPNIKLPSHTSQGVVRRT